MKLTQSQVDNFERDGYLFFPGLFSPDEGSNLSPWIALPWKDRFNEPLRQAS